MVSARGGVGLAARTDHSDGRQVEALFKRVDREQGRLDLLVNDISEGVEHEWKPFWKLPLEPGLRALRQGIDTHIITTRHAAPLMVKQKSGLVVEIGDGDALFYRGNLFYDLVKVTAARLAYAWAEELRPHKVAALYVTPGFMRTEAILEGFNVTEANWRDAAETNKQAKAYGFAGSETPCFVGRAVAALAADPNLLRKSGGLYSSWGLSDEYGFTDIDGARPHAGRYFAEHFPHLFTRQPNVNFDWTLTRRPAPDGPAREHAVEQLRHPRAPAPRSSRPATSRPRASARRTRAASAGAWPRTGRRCSCGAASRS